MNHGKHRLHICYPYSTNEALLNDTNINELVVFTVTYMLKIAFLANFNLRCNFWSMKDRYFILSMHTLRSFKWYQYQWPWNFDLDLYAKNSFLSANYNLCLYFWTMKDRDFIFGLHTTLIKLFQMTSRLMTLWPWLWPVY